MSFFNYAVIQFGYGEISHHLKTLIVLGSLRYRESITARAPKSGAMSKNMLRPCRVLLCSTLAPSEHPSAHQ